MKLKFRGSNEKLRRSLKLIPHVLSGKRPDTLGIHDVFWGFVANAALDCVYRAFKQKASGRTGEDGIKWAKLAAATLAARERKGITDDSILKETGQLLASLQPGRDGAPSGAEWQVFNIERGGVSVGTMDRTADRHQNGTDYMPKRPIVRPDTPFTEVQERRIERAMQKALVRVIEMICTAGGID